MFTSDIGMHILHCYPGLLGDQVTHPGSIEHRTGAKYLVRG